MAKEGSQDLRWQYGHYHQSSEIYQQALKYEQKDKEGKQKGPPPKTSFYNGVIRRTNEEIEYDEAYKKACKESELRQAREERAKAEELHKQTVALQSGTIDRSKVISVKSLYDQGLAKAAAGEPKEAVRFYWKAFACGHKEAAYELYEVFHTGAGGAIRKNEVAAVTFARAGNYLGESRCIDVWTKGKFKSQDLVSLNTWCKAAARDYQGNVTTKIIDSLVTECNEAIAYKFGTFGSMEDLINAPIVISGGDSCVIL